MKKRKHKTINLTYLLIDIIHIQGKIIKLNCPGGELYVELIKINFSQYKISQCLLKKAFTQLLHSPWGKHGLRRLGKVPRKHLSTKKRKRRRKEKIPSSNFSFFPSITQVFQRIHRQSSSVTTYLHPSQKNGGRKEKEDGFVWVLDTNK